MTSRVCIAVPTYRRAEGLHALLDGLALVRTAAELDVRIVVLDNDAAGSARAIVANSQVGYPFGLAYESVPEPGLSAVRNAALAYADRRADYLAMIDDDEVPEPQWLLELMRVRGETGADAVVGPVPAIVPDEAPSWFGTWRRDEMPRPADGSWLADGWSGNCLLDVRRMRDLGAAFDPSMNFSGGEDQLFFRQIVARGGRIAYAAGATAWERMPADRTSLRFVVARSFRKGNTLAICDRRISGSLAAIALRVVKGLALTAVGSLRAVASAISRHEYDRVRSACDVASGIGMIAGLVGVAYQPYRRSA